MGGGTILLFNVMSPGVTKQMTSSFIGSLGIAIAGILWTIAFVLIRKTTKVDV